MNEKGLKGLGLALTIGGALIGVASTLVGSKQQENLINKKVSEEVTKQLKGK